MQMYPYLFNPIYKEYIWGGRKLKDWGRKFTSPTVAESWEISVREEGDSIIENGPLKGSSLSRVISTHGADVVGSDLARREVFPMLIKLIDANGKLSVQVHPDDSYALANEKDPSGKHEMWYILEAGEEANIVLGLKEDVDRDTFLDYLKGGKVEQCLNYVRVKKGDIIDIPPGVIHALGENILLVEIQQNSDNTYRVYDYDRIDGTGKKRELHVEKALDVIDFHNKNRPHILNFSDMDPGCKKIMANRHFETFLLNIKDFHGDETTGEKFHAYIFIEKGGTVEYGRNYSNFVHVAEGRTVFIPAAMGKYRIRGEFYGLKTFVGGDG